MPAGRGRRGRPDAPRRCSPVAPGREPGAARGAKRPRRAAAGTVAARGSALETAAARRPPGAVGRRIRRRRGPGPAPWSLRSGRPCAAGCAPIPPLPGAGFWGLAEEHERAQELVRSPRGEITRRQSCCQSLVDWRRGPAAAGIGHPRNACDPLRGRSCLSAPVSRCQISIRHRCCPQTYPMSWRGVGCPLNGGKQVEYHGDSNVTPVAATRDHPTLRRLRPGAGRGPGRRRRRPC